MPEPPLQKRGNRRTPANLKRLKAHIQRLEGFGGNLAEANRQVLPFGIDEIDDRPLGGGLARALCMKFSLPMPVSQPLLRTAGRRLAKMRRTLRSCGANVRGRQTSAPSTAWRCCSSVSTRHG